MTSERDRISEATAFDTGDTFEDEAQVREYFTMAAMVDMFGPGWAEGGREWNEPAPLWTQGEPWTQDDLDQWAGLVSGNRWHWRDMTAAEVAVWLEVDGSTIRHAIADERITATKRGRDYFIAADEARRYGRERKARPRRMADDHAAAFAERSR